MSLSLFHLCTFHVSLSAKNILWAKDFCKYFLHFYYNSYNRMYDHTYFRKLNIALVISLNGNVSTWGRERIGRKKTSTDTLLFMSTTVFSCLLVDVLCTRDTRHQRLAKEARSEKSQIVQFPWKLGLKKMFWRLFILIIDPDSH